KSIILVFLILCINSSYPQSDDENKSLFKLGSTPFISKSKLNVNLSYGVNYGSPSFLMQQWILPNDKKKVMFSNINGSISVGNELEAYIKYTDGYSLAYNNSHLGVEYRNEDYNYGVKWKIINSENYAPDLSIDLNSSY